jgi:predicted DNA-binding protein (MmcQ/YjbR family)
VELREATDAITPGYHMNKKHWNTVRVDGSVSESLFLELVDHSYELVWNSLTRAERTKLTG